MIFTLILHFKRGILVKTHFVVLCNPKRLKMAALKTQEHEGSVIDFITAFTTTEQKKTDALQLLAFMERVTGLQPKMWGDSVIGFGKYHYKSDRSKQEGDWPLVAFSPRKTAISLYVYSGCSGQEALLPHLGTYKMGAACIYVKKLANIDLEVLEQLILSTIAFLTEKYA